MRLSYTDAYLPRGQAQEAAHGEDGEVQNSAVGGLVSVPHLLLPAPHEGKVLHDGLAHVLQPLELHLKGLQLGGVPEVLVVLCLNPVLSGEADLRQNRLYFVLCVHEYIVL